MVCGPYESVCVDNKKSRLDPADDEWPIWRCFPLERMIDFPTPATRRKPGSQLLLHARQPDKAGHGSISANRLQERTFSAKTQNHVATQAQIRSLQRASNT